MIYRQPRRDRPVVERHITGGAFLEPLALQEIRNAAPGDAIRAGLPLPARLRSMLDHPLPGSIDNSVVAVLERNGGDWARSHVPAPSLPETPARRSSPPD